MLSPTIPKIPIGISACLLGERVRYNGAHKRDAWITGQLGRIFRWIPVCPEIEIGLGVPRAPIQLEYHGGQIRLVEIGTHRDLTGRMDQYAREKIRDLHRMSIRGFILKRDSPSCGLRGIPVYNTGGRIQNKDTGRFAHALQQMLPLCPLEEEDHLHNRRFLKQFFIRVFTYDRWQRFLTTPPSHQSLLRFHRQHALLVMAHHPLNFKKMCHLVYTSRRSHMHILLPQYGRLLMHALQHPPDRFGHVRALTRILANMRSRISPAKSTEALDLLMLYRRGKVSGKTIWQWFQDHMPSITDSSHIQTYFHPYPSVLNHRFNLNPID